MNYLGQHPVRVAAGATGLAGAVKGSGVYETEEEKANTSGLGRLGKIATNSALGATVGAGSMVINQKASQLGLKYTRGSGGSPVPDNILYNQVPDFSKL